MLTCVATNQKPPAWCAIITLSAVALFHFHLTTDLHWTMDPADLKVPLSFLHGWWTPHLSSFTQHKHCSEADVCFEGGDKHYCQWGWSLLRSSSSFPEIDCWLFNYSRCWIMSFSVFICVYPDRRSLSEGWVMAESMGGGRISIDGFGSHCWMFKLKGSNEDEKLITCFT